MTVLRVLAYWIAPSMFLVGVAVGVALEERAHAARHICHRRRKEHLAIVD